MSSSDGVTPKPGVLSTGLGTSGSASSLNSALSTNVGSTNFLLGCRKVQTKKTKGRMGVKRANVLKLLPSRLASRIYGQVNSLPIPYHLRHLAYTSWAMAFKAKLDEVPLPLTAYPSLVSFFTRKLKPGVRPVDDKAAIVSPADSAVVSTSSDLMGTGILRQVKGFDFRVEDFLGMNAPPKVTTPGNVLHSIVLYLSPGDYHRFHSPTEWTVESRTHIAGQLLPVNPIVAHLLPSLLCTNERVALMGKWHHGFFSYTAVGATNVGSIRLTSEPELFTNLWRDDWRTGFSVNDALGLKPATLRVPQAVDPRIGLKKLAQLSAQSSQAVAAHLPKGIPMAVTSLGKTIYSSLQSFNPLAFLAPQRKLEKQISAAAAATAAARQRSGSNASGTGGSSSVDGSGEQLEAVGAAAAEAALLAPARSRRQLAAASMASMVSAHSRAASTMTMAPLPQVKEETNEDDGDISPPLKVKAPTTITTAATGGITGLIGGFLGVGGGKRAARANSFLDDGTSQPESESSQQQPTAKASSSSSSGGGACPAPPFVKKASARPRGTALKKVTTAQAFAAATAPSAGAVSRVSGETVVNNSSAPSGAYLPSAPIIKSRHYDNPLKLLAGDEIGWFELGSTVVLIFEAPKDFKFSEGIADCPGRKVVLGTPLTPVEREWHGPRGIVQGLTPEQAHDFLNASAKEEREHAAQQAQQQAEEGVEAALAGTPVATNASSGAGAMPSQPPARSESAAPSVLSAAVMGVLPSSWLKAAGMGGAAADASGTGSSAADAAVAGMLEGHPEGSDEEGDDEEEEDEHEFGDEDAEEGEEEGEEEEEGETEEEEDGAAISAVSAEDDPENASAALERLEEEEGIASDDDFLSAVSFDDEDAKAMEAVVNERWGENPVIKGATA